MKTSDYKALSSTFDGVVRAVKNELAKLASANDQAEIKLARQASIKEKKKAWNRLIREFVKVEMKDRLELINFWLCMPNPLAAVKLDIFERELFHSRFYI
jgi:hypothetical protein